MSFSIKLNERDIDGERLLDDLRSVATRLSKNSVTMAEYDEFGSFHPSTIVRRFGSWFIALEKANLCMSRTPMGISEVELFKNIETVWLALGRQPKYQEVRSPLSRYSARTYDKRFGSWNRSLLLFREWVQSEEDDSNDNEIESNLQAEQSSPKHKTRQEISDRLRFRILMRDGFTCVSCGASPGKTLGVELHVDHIIPWSKGGETEESNLQTKCSQCNLGKGNAFLL